MTAFGNLSESYSSLMAESMKDEESGRDRKQGSKVLNTKQSQNMGKDAVFYSLLYLLIVCLLCFS